jgi:hypothetical protein
MVCVSIGAQGFAWVIFCYFLQPRPSAAAKRPASRLAAASAAHPDVSVAAHPAAAAPAAVAPPATAAAAASDASRAPGGGQGPAPPTATISISQRGAHVNGAADRSHAPDVAAGSAGHAAGADDEPQHVLASAAGAEVSEGGASAAVVSGHPAVKGAAADAHASPQPADSHSRGRAESVSTAAAAQDAAAATHQSTSGKGVLGSLLRAFRGIHPAASKSASAVSAEVAAAPAARVSPAAF